MQWSMQRIMNFGGDGKPLPTEGSGISRGAILALLYKVIDIWIEFN